MADPVIDDITKAELSNGNYNVSFMLDGVPQTWLNVPDWQCESDELFVAFVLEVLEAPPQPEPEIPPLTAEELEAMP